MIVPDSDPGQGTMPPMELTRGERGTPNNSPIRRRSSTPSTPTSPGIKGKFPLDLTCGCGKRFPDVGQLHSHQLDLQHFKDKYCYLCDKRFQKLSNFKRHNDTQHSQKRATHLCVMCNKSFARYDNLQDHQLKKHSAICCRHCHLSFPSRQELKEHVQAAHRGPKMLRIANHNSKHAK